MRGCGVLLHITSLPGKGGVGTLGDEARNFVDFLAAAGQSWWQVLPLTPPARGDSPYSSYSVFAGNPALINLEELEREKLLSLWTQSFVPRHTGERANYEFTRKVHLPLLRQTHKPGMEKYREQVAQFRRQNSFWLEDYALFMALKKEYDGAPFQQWPEPISRRDPAALDRLRDRLADDISFWVWVQYLFFRQWDSLRRYADTRGVGFIGDMPIYTDVDSADVWAGSANFLLDAGGSPTQVAGVPPDYFSEDGQLWGNPLYNWDYLKSTGYSWWTQRLALSAKMYTRTRLDHFRGLDEFYAIPSGAANARKGTWLPGPGLDFLDHVAKHVPDCSLIAEDLGVETPSLRKLLADSGLPGMKVLQFAFDPQHDSPFLPHNYSGNCVAYTGTHDNDTVMGWMRTAPEAQVDFAKQYLFLNRREGYYWGFIRGLYASAADTAIVPMQDFLGLGSYGRMNIPATPQGNWGWRLDKRCLTPRLSLRMRELAHRYRRIPSGD